MRYVIVCVWANSDVIQAFVPFCLLAAIWFLQAEQPQYNHVFTALGFGAVLQMMSLTFYIMQGRR